MASYGLSRRSLLAASAFGAAGALLAACGVAGIVAGEPPDVQQSNYSPMFMWQLQGALEAVDPYLDKRGKSDYYTKRIGILGGSNSNIGEVERRLKAGSILPPLESAFLPPPHAPGKKPAAFVAIQSFLVFKQTKDPDRTAGAMQFGNFLTDTPAQKAITSIGELPVRKTAGNIYAADANRTTGFAVIEHGRSMGRFPENGDVRVLWQDAIRAVWKREKAPKEALDEMVRLSEPIMAKNAARGGTK